MRTPGGSRGDILHRMGRPRNPSSTDRRVQVLLRTIDERRVLEAAADAAGLPVSTWARRVLLEAAGHPDLVPEEPHVEAARALVARRRRR